MFKFTCLIFVLSELFSWKRRCFMGFFWNIN